jgi:hypothetical protein
MSHLYVEHFNNIINRAKWRKEWRIWRMFWKCSVVISAATTKIDWVFRGFSLFLYENTLNYVTFAFFQILSYSLYTRIHTLYAYSLSYRRLYLINSKWINKQIFSETYTLRISVLCSFPHPPLTSSFLGSFSVTCIVPTRLCLSVFSYNFRGKAMCQRCYWKFHGLLKKYFFISIPLTPYSYGVEVFIFLWIYTQSVGLLGRVIGPSQGLYLNTVQRKHRINTHTHKTSIP